MSGRRFRRDSRNGVWTAGLGVLGEMVYAGQGSSFQAGERLARGHCLMTRISKTFVRRLDFGCTRSKAANSRAACRAVHQMFVGQLTAREALARLMERPVGAES